MFFGGVAGFAARHHIAPGAFAAARNRDDVIHGQRFGRGCASAIMTFAFGHPALPPLGLPQLPGLAAFSFYVSFIKIICKWFLMKSFCLITAVFIKQY